MAFEESYGGQENPGRPYFYKNDARRGVDVKLVITPVEMDDRDAMNKKYGERKRNKISREMEWRIPEKNTDAANKFLAMRVWKDTENAYVKLANQDAVDLYNKELGESFSIGAEVLMDGRWTEALKLDLLTLPMANWIVVKSTDAEAEVDIGDEEKNSQSSSNSDSETTAPLPMRSVSGAN